MRFLRIAFVVPLLFALSACGGGGSAGVPASTVPTFSNVEVNSYLSDGGIVLTIVGTNFPSNTVVKWGGVTLSSSFISGSQIEAEVPYATLLKVDNTLLSMMSGNDIYWADEYAFVFLQPRVNSISPVSVSVGSTQKLSVFGSNFVPLSVIRANGQSLKTTYISDSELQAFVPAVNTAMPNSITIDVLNPAPPIPQVSYGAALLEVGYSVKRLHLPVNDLIWDATHGVIYLSISYASKTHPNTIDTLDPTTGKIVSTKSTGIQPYALAISDDDSFLYAAIDGADSVERFELPSFSSDLTINFGSYFAFALDVAPGAPHTIAVSLGNGNLTTQAVEGVFIYDDGVQRPTSIAPLHNIYDSLQWGTDDTELFGSDYESTSGDLYSLSVNSGGVTLSNTFSGVFSTFDVPFGTSIDYDRTTDLIYGGNGFVVNKSTGQVVGTLSATSNPAEFNCAWVVPDGTLNRAYCASVNDTYEGDESGTIDLTSFDLTTYAPINKITIPNIGFVPIKIIRWGTDGLAFNTADGQLIIIKGSFVTD